MDSGPFEKEGRVSYKSPVISSLPRVVLEGNEYEPWNPYGPNPKRRPFVIIQKNGSGQVEVLVQPPEDFLMRPERVSFKVEREMLDLLAQAIFTYQSVLTERGHHAP